MAETKRLVCLANSRKHSGRCIAGKEIRAEGYGQWIRPISARPSAEISEEERRYENGVSPRVLDIINIRMVGAAPHLYQSENYMIDANYYWVKAGELARTGVKEILDTPAPLWTNNDSTYNGLNDRIRIEIAAKLTRSLTLIEPEDLTIKVVTEGADFGNPRRRVRAEFKHVDADYNLIVTDPVAEAVLLAKPNAEYKLNNTYLCISLGEAYTDGWCYKLVATVFTEQPL
jgi:hypothetical protein